MFRLLLGLQSLFTVWMVVDAIQRRAERYWYAVIVFVPFGSIVYFFMVKVHDPQFRGLREFFANFGKPKATLEFLSHQAAESPSLANKLALAQGLFDARMYEEAGRGFEQVLMADDENKDALYGLALCRLEHKDLAGAVAPLEALIEIKPSYREYAAYPRLAYVLQRSEQGGAALTLLAELVRKSPRVTHRLIYARYLRDAQKLDEARLQLELALREHEHAPRYQQRQDSAAARNARALLAELETG